LKKKKKNIIKPSELFSWVKKQKVVLLLILILAAGFSYYYKTTGFDLLTWDDDKQIINNHEIKSLDKGTFLRLYHFDKHTSLTLFTFALNFDKHRNHPRIYHLHNVYLHVLNILLVFILIKKIFRKNSVALICAVLFAFHPSRIESVAWVSERKDLLFTFFSLSALLIYIQYLNGKFKLFFLFLFLLTAYLAGLSKIQGIAIIPLTFLFDWFYRREISVLMFFEKFALFFLIFVFYIDFIFSFQLLKPTICVLLLLILAFISEKIKKTFKIKSLLGFFFVLFWYLTGYKLMLLPFLAWFLFSLFLEDKMSDIHIPKAFIIKYKNYLIIVASFILILAGFFLQKKFAFWSPESDPTVDYHFTDRIFLGAASLLFYLNLFIFPFNLNAIHPYPPKAEGLLPLEYYASFFICLVIIGVISYFLFKKKFSYKKEMIFLIIFFLINISMVLHIIPIQGRLIYADRYPYFGFIGLFALIGILYEEKKQWFQKKKWTYIIALIYLLSMSVYGYSRMNTWANSEILFSEVLEKNPDVSIAHNNLGAAMLKYKKKDKCMYHLNRSIALDTNFNLAYYNRAMAYYKFDEFEKAEKDLRLLIRRQRDSLDQALNYNDLGMTLLQMGKKDDALEYIEKARLLNPRFDKTFNNLGWIKYLDKDFPEAIKMFNKALEVNPNMDEALTNRGWCKLQSGDGYGAIDDFNKAVEINPYNEKALSNRGALRTNIKDFDGAIDDISRAIEINPGFEVAYANRAYAFFNKGDLQNTIRDYASAIKLNPKNTEHYLNRGWALFMSGKYNEALADYEKGISLKEPDASALTNIGIIRHKAGYSEKGLKDLDSALSLNAKLWKTYFYKGIILYDKSEYKKAEKPLQKSIELNNRNAETYLYLAKTYFTINNKTEGCKALEQAVKLGNSQAKNLFDKECAKK